MGAAQGLAYLDLFFQYVAILSANLAVFNLLPIPPLDGSKVLYVILPRGSVRSFRCGMSVLAFFLLAVLLWTGVLDAPFEFPAEWTHPPALAHLQLAG